MRPEESEHTWVSNVRACCRSCAQLPVCSDMLMQKPVIPRSQEFVPFLGDAMYSIETMPAYSTGARGRRVGGHVQKSGGPDPEDKPITMDAKSFRTHRTLFDFAARQIFEPPRRRPPQQSTRFCALLVKMVNQYRFIPTSIVR